MKLKHYALIFLLFQVLLPAELEAQNSLDIPEVSYDQGKIIGSLPYGRQFYIIGSSKLPNNGRADAVKVKIWSTGRTVFNRKKKLQQLTGDKIASILAGPPLDSAVWYADRTEDVNTYRLYMDKALQFSSEYMMEFTFSERVNFKLSEEEKTLVMGNIQNRVLAVGKSKGGIGVSEIQSIINEEVTTYLASQDQYASLFDGGTTTTSNYGNLPISPLTLQNLSQAIGRYVSQEQLITLLGPQVEQAKDELANMPADSPDRADLEMEIQSIEKQLNNAIGGSKDAQEQLPELLLIIRSKLIETYSSYVITSPEEISVTELNAIKIGTAFGGGMVGFNTFQDNKDLDVFGYTALKFYLLPVDKRIAQPYLAGPYFINKLSILVGVSVSGDLNYHGQILDKAVGFYPIIGLSYDVNRYLSIDLGTTLFKQPSISPLTNDSDIRIGPVIGINFDGDLFNRFNALFSGSDYKVNPGN
ncbi:MAG: hypothetical protein KDC34_16795 [Saprospiraceae bacterium]|nr:hypothetical protein [Saprospiraceae bacterium]